MPNLDELPALLIQKEPVLFITTVGPPLPSRAGRFLEEVFAGRHIVNRAVNEHVVKPKLPFIIADRFLRLQTIGDVNVWITIVIQIESRASPGPTRASDGGAQSGLFETT